MGSTRQAAHIGVGDSDDDRSVREDRFDLDVCVLGTGRVGLPLALALAESGLRVVGIERNPSLRDAVNAGRMPFRIPGFESLIARRILELTPDASVASRARGVVVAVGTPPDPCGGGKTRQLDAALDDLRPYLRRGQLLCLRSTVPPGTTARVAEWLARETELRVGHDIGLAYCPERIAEGRARVELAALPQLVGAQDPRSFAAAEELFGRVSPSFLREDWLTAELAKVFSNVTRWVEFALGNQLAAAAEALGSDIHRVRRIANHGYPRQHVPSPGLTGGPCLHKDAAMLLELAPGAELLAAAGRAHTTTPAFLVSQMSRRLPLEGARLAVLGWTFKAESDDVRESLAPVLVELLRRERPAEVRISDPYLGDPLPVTPTTGTSTTGTSITGASITGGSTEASRSSASDAAGIGRNWPADEILAGVDGVFVATNHAAFAPLLRRWAASLGDAWIADPWNGTGVDRIFFRARELT